VDRQQDERRSDDGNGDDVLVEIVRDGGGGGGGIRMRARVAAGGIVSGGLRSAEAGEIRKPLIVAGSIGAGAWLFATASQ
jgi:hypothetical protein